MIDRAAINEKIEKLREYLTLLKEYRKSNLKELKEDPKLQGAVRCYLQLSIKCVIGIGEIIISGLRLPRPEEAREVIEILGKNKIIPISFSKHFSSVAGFRNILVHEYTKVDINKLYQHLRNDLKDFDFYIRHIVKFIELKKAK